jgi:hypothetical protein
MRPSICISGLSRAERKAGQLLQGMEKLKGRPKKASTDTRLSDLGISVINREPRRSANPDRDVLRPVPPHENSPMTRERLLLACGLAAVASAAALVIALIMLLD